MFLFLGYVFLSNDGRRTTPPEEKIPTRKYCHLGLTDQSQKRF